MAFASVCSALLRFWLVDTLSQRPQVHGNYISIRLPFFMAYRQAKLQSRGSVYRLCNFEQLLLYLLGSLLRLEYADEHLSSTAFTQGPACLSTPQVVVLCRYGH